MKLTMKMNRICELSDKLDQAGDYSKSDELDIALQNLLKDTDPSTFEDRWRNLMYKGDPESHTRFQAHRDPIDSLIQGLNITHDSKTNLSTWSAYFYIQKDIVNDFIDQINDYCSDT